MTQTTLLTKTGDCRTLPVVLISDYLKTPLTLEVSESFEDEENTFYEKLPMLKVSEHCYVETPAAMLRHVLRNSEGQTLLNESDFSANKTETVMSFVF